jgi:hypothetical protein
MGRHRRELVIPDRVAGDANGSELLRAWACGGKQHISINTGVFDDPFAWGMMLVDLARHVANAFDQSGRMKNADVLDRIKRNFDAKWPKSREF